MTIYEKLIEELGCAISAVYGGAEDEEYEDGKITKHDLDAIARKVAFYLDL